MGGHVNMQGNSSVHVPPMHMQQPQNTPPPPNAYVSQRENNISRKFINNTRVLFYIHSNDNLLL